MIKLILSGLMLISLQAKLCAQTAYLDDYSKRMSRSKTEQTFNAYDGLINIRSYVVLKEGSMILEVNDERDYAAIKNLDSILANVKKDIAFYKDSLDGNPTGNMRIDYVLNEEYPFKKIRFKRYNADGASFLNRDGEVSRLKFEQDTVRIIIHKLMPGLGKGKNGPCQVAFAIQATFILGNYYDIDKVLADKVLNSVVDTLEKASHVERQPRFNHKQMTLQYNPYYSGPGRFLKTDFLVNSEFAVRHNYQKPRISFNPQFGAGLVRNTLTPVADVGFQYNRYWNNFKERNIYRLSGTGYYFFEKDESGNYRVHDNWFINATIGSISERVDPGWYGREASVGVGYLVSQKGNYFKNNAMRIFTHIMIVRGVSVVPEVIFNNNFKEIFPGITIKILQ